MSVYMDLYFAANLLMDYLLLSAVGSRFRPRRGRRLLAALFGSLCACGALFLGFFGWKRLLLVLPVASLMLMIAHSPVSAEGFARDLFCLLCCSFFFSGLLPFLLVYLRLWLLCVALTYLGLRAFLFFWGRRRRRVLLQIQVGDACWRVPALVDSGSSLRDPITGLPVILVRRSSLPGHPGGSHPIPYHTVDSHGLLMAFRPDRVCIDAELVPAALIAPAPDFPGSSAIQAIIPEALTAVPFTLL